MLGTETGYLDLVFKFRYEDGSPFIVYHTAAINDPSDHVIGKWYYRLYPAAATDPCGPFDSLDAAERAARDDRDGPAPRYALRA